MILASCSLEEAKKYSNKLVVVSDVEGKKLEEVQLNVVTSNPDEAMSKGVGVAKCITTDVSPSICPDKYKGNVFRVYKYPNIEGVDDEVDGVVPLITLPEDFSNMREIFDMSQNHPNVRFIGGNLLEIPGVKIGRYDKGKEKMSSHFFKVYDIFREVDLNTIKVQEVMSKIRSKSASGSRVKKSAQKKPSVKAKKVETFAKFFGECSNEF